MSAALRLTPYRPDETDIHEMVATALDRLLLPPAMWTTLPIGHVRLTGQQAAKLARLGVARGWPDLIVLHHYAYGIELKRPGGTLSRSRLVPTRKGGRRMVEGQREVFPRLEAAGLRIAVCESLAQVLAALAGWGVPLRGCA
jgi:hypothetical protein